VKLQKESPDWADYATIGSIHEQWAAYSKLCVILVRMLDIAGAKKAYRECGRKSKETVNCLNSLCALALKEASLLVFLFSTCELLLQGTAAKDSEFSACKKAVKENPQDQLALHNMAMYYLTVIGCFCLDEIARFVCIFQVKKDYKPALPYMRKNARLNPGEIVHWRNLGIALDQSAACTLGYFLG